MFLNQSMVVLQRASLFAQLGDLEDSQDLNQNQNQNFLDNLVNQLGQDLPNLIYALVIFVAGLIISFLIEWFIRFSLDKTKLDEQIADWIAGEDRSEAIPIAKSTGRIVRWIIILFTIVAALKRLQLQEVSQPLNTLLEQITGFLPQLGGAAILLGFAWVVAKVVKLITSRVLQGINIDQRFGEQVGTTDSDISLSETISNTLYWFIFLIFLPSILSTLELEGTLVPVQTLVNDILQILPRVFGAALIVFIGWFIAQIVRKIVTNLLASSGIDQVGNRFGLSGTGNIQSLSWIIGTVVYVLILIPVAIAGLEAVQVQAISEPAVAMLDQILNTLPRIFTATLLLIITYFLAQYISEFVTNLLTNVGFNNLFSWLGLQRPGEGATTPTTGQGNQEQSSQSAIQMRTPSQLMGIIVLVGIMLFASLAAVNILDIEALTELVSGIVLVSGQIIAGLIIFAIGLYFANVAFNLILSANMQQSRTLAQAARIIIIAFSLALGLQQMGIAPDIVNLAFGLLFGSIAVAIALAFGLGAREIAAEQVREWVNSFKSSRNR